MMAPPFAILLERLRSEGFTIGVEHYIRVARALDPDSGSYSPKQMRSRLCALLAVSPYQQARFHEIFEEIYPIFEPDAVPDAEALFPIDIARQLSDISAARVAARIMEWMQQGGRLAVNLAIIIIIFVQSVSYISDSISDSIYKLPDPPTLAPAQKTKSVDTIITKFFPNKRISTEWHIVAVMLAALPLAALALLILRRRREAEQIWEELMKRRLPYAWPLEITDRMATLFRRDEMHIIARRLWNRELYERIRLDVEASITATIASNGFTEFRYRNEDRIPEYLVLIDRTAARDHQASYFAEITEKLIAEGVLAEIFFFRTDPRVCHPANGGASVRLEELARRFPAHRLVMVSDGSGVLDPMTGALVTWASELEGWRNRALLTGRPLPTWGREERTLSEMFVVLPSQRSIFAIMADRFDADAPPPLTVLRGAYEVAPPVEDQSNPVEALRHSLDGNVFLWVCTLAIYPELHWKLSRHLAPLFPDAEVMTEEHLLWLFRISWFRAGAIPDDIRWRLLNELERHPDLEHRARAAVIAVMQGTRPEEGTFAKGDHQLRLALQMWLHDPVRSRLVDLKEKFRRASPTERNRDGTLLRFLQSGRTLSNRLLPFWLRRIIFREGASPLGLRSPVVAFLTVAAAFACWLGVTNVTTTTDFIRRDTTVTHDVVVIDTTMGSSDIAIDFGEVVVGESRRQHATISIDSASAGMVRIEGIEAPFNVLNYKKGDEIGPDSVAIVNVDFSPREEKEYIDTAFVVSTQTGDTVRRIALRGKGVKTAGLRVVSMTSTVDKIYVDDTAFVTVALNRRTTLAVQVKLGGDHLYADYPGVVTVPAGDSVATFVLMGAAPIIIRQVDHVTITASLNGIVLTLSIPVKQFLPPRGEFSPYEVVRAQLNGGPGDDSAQGFIEFTNPLPIGAKVYLNPTGFSPLEGELDNNDELLITHDQYEALHRPIGVRTRSARIPISFETFSPENPVRITCEISVKILNDSGVATWVGRSTPATVVLDLGRDTDSSFILDIKYDEVESGDSTTAALRFKAPLRKGTIARIATYPGEYLIVPESIDISSRTNIHAFTIRTRPGLTSPVDEYIIVYANGQKVTHKIHIVPAIRFKQFKRLEPYRDTVTISGKDSAEVRFTLYCDRDATGVIKLNNEISVIIDDGDRSFNASTKRWVSIKDRIFFVISFPGNIVPVIDQVKTFRITVKWRGQSISAPVMILRVMK